MAVLCDSQIQELIGIEPFSASERRPDTVSYGVSSYGYDVRVGTRFKIFTNATSGGISIVDPEGVLRMISSSPWIPEETDRDHVIIPPNSFALAETVEWMDIPRDVMVVCLGKSTYARCGLIVNVTPLEPEWRGRVTLEISNTTPLPAKVYANEGIAQMVFLKADQGLCTELRRQERQVSGPGGTHPAKGGLTRGA